MIARNVRNVIYNYTDAQRKVRTATSNDAWGPSPALMHEIATLTDNAVAYAEIMPIIWKRLNDHGKNWRHVYKSLVLLDHLIKYGNERVVQQCKENIFAIQTLKDFQHVEDQKDQGYNVREKAKQLVSLLKDEERLRNERRKAQEGRDHYMRQAIAMDSRGAVTYGQPAGGSAIRRNSIEGRDPYGSASYATGTTYQPYASPNRSTSYNDNLRGAAVKDYVIPSSQEEEQLQMQIALAESQREAEDEERRRRNDDLKLRIALERSVSETINDAHPTQLVDFNGNNDRYDPSAFDSQLQHPYMLPATTTSAAPWHASTNQGIGFSGLNTTTSSDPWGSGINDHSSSISAPKDPWQATASASGWQPIPNSQPANPWSGQSSMREDPNAGLSLNLSDPWGLGTTKSQTSTTMTAASVIPKTSSGPAIEDELSSIFGTSTTISTSNPWSTPATTNFPLPASNVGSVSPPMTNLAMTTGSVLYPTIASRDNTTPNSTSPSAAALSSSRKTPESFLGDKFRTLVNLDELVTENKTTNPFGSTATRTPNPFVNANKAPTLEQLTVSNTPNFTSGSNLPPPLIPSSYNASTNNNSSYAANNPFL